MGRLHLAERLEGASIVPLDQRNLVSFFYIEGGVN